MDSTASEEMEQSIFDEKDKNEVNVLEGELRVKMKVIDSEIGKFNRMNSLLVQHLQALKQDVVNEKSKNYEITLERHFVELNKDINQLKTIFDSMKSIVDEANDDIVKMGPSSKYIYSRGETNTKPSCIDLLMFMQCKVEMYDDEMCDRSSLIGRFNYDLKVEDLNLIIISYQNQPFVIPQLLHLINEKQMNSTVF